MAGTFRTGARRFSDRRRRATLVCRTVPERNRTALQALAIIPLILFVSVSSTAVHAQGHRPEWAPTQTEIRQSSASHLNPSPADSSVAEAEHFQTQTGLARTRPHSGNIVQASASSLKVPRRTSQPESPATVSPVTDPDLARPRQAAVDFASQLPDDESHLSQLFNVLQWTVAVLLVAVVAALGLKKYGRGAFVPPADSVMTLVATLPVRNHFQAHLLEIAGQRFLVTTDRGGVKTVNPITNWESFDDSVPAPVLS